jgi:hypothetical protein
MPIISVLGRLRQEDQKFQASLGYKERPCLKKNKNKKDECESRLTISSHPLFSLPQTPSKHLGTRANECHHKS